MKKKYRALFWLPWAVIALDQVTKLTVTDRFTLHESLPVVSGFFNLTYVQNTGAAFGILSGAPPIFRIPFFILVPMLALSAIAYLFKKLPDQDWKLSAALSLVIGGAIGNLIDRIRLHYVIDFLDFHWNNEYHFPAFNVADSAICVGVAVLLLDLAFQKEDEHASHPA